MAEDSKNLPMLADLVTYKENEKIVYPDIKMPPEPELEEAPVDSSYSRKRNFFSFYSKKQPGPEKRKGNHGQTMNNNNKVFNINTNRLGLVHVGWDGNAGGTTKEELIVKPKLEDISEDGTCSFVPKNYINNNDIAEEIVVTISLEPLKKKIQKLKKKVTIELPSKEENNIDRNEINQDNSKNISKLVVCFIEEIIIEAKRQNYSLYSNIPMAPSFPFQKIIEQKSVYQTQPLHIQIPKENENTDHHKNTFDLHSITPEKTGDFSNVEISPKQAKIQESVQSEKNGKEPNNNIPRGSNGKSEQKKTDGFSGNEGITEKNGLKPITFDCENPFPNLNDDPETMKTTLMNCSNDEQNNDNIDDWVIDVKSKILQKKNNRKSNDRYIIVNNKNKISIEKVSKSDKPLLYNSISDSDTLNKLTTAKKNYLKQNQVVTYKKMIKDLLDELMKPKATKKKPPIKKGTRIYDIMPTLLILKQKIDFLCSNDLKTANKLENTNKNYRLKSYLFLVREFGLNEKTIFNEKINENTFENDLEVNENNIIVDKKKIIYKYFEDYSKSKTFLHFLVNRINDIYEENERRK